MLTLAGSVRANGFTVYRDVEWRDGARVLTARCYALPDAPRLANEDDGGPALHATIFRRGPGAGGGGVLGLTIELAASDEERAELQRALPALLGVPEVEVLDVPFCGGTATLSFAGDGEGGDLASHTAGSGPATLVPGQRASFLVELTADGAALLDRALAAPLLVARVGYDLQFERALDGATLHVWCDGRRVYDLAAAAIGGAVIGADELRRRLEEARAVGCDLQSDAPIPDDEQAALVDQGRKLVETALASALFRWDGSSATGLSGDGGQVGTLKSREEATAGFDYTFRQSYPAIAHAAPSALLSLALDDAQRAARVAIVDLDAVDPQPLEIAVVCPLDFAPGAVAAVVVALAHGDDEKALTFRAPGVQRARFSVERGAPRAYRYKVTVSFTDETEPLVLDWTDSDRAQLVAPPPGFGLFPVTVALGDVPFETVRGATVDLAYPARDLETTVTLDGTSPRATWPIVTRAAAPAPFRYRATWLTTDGRRLASEFAQSTAPRLFLDAPPELRPGGRVLLLAACDFADVAQIVVELRAKATDPPAEITFTRDGDSATWSAPAGPLRYQIRTTFAYRDGTRRAGDFRDDDSPLQVLRDAARFTVHVVPRLLDLGGALAVALVAWEHDDDQGRPLAHGEIAFTDRNSDGSFQFQPPDPARHRYRYQLTLVGKDGTRRAQPFRDGDQEILVLRPDTSEE